MEFNIDDCINYPIQEGAVKVEKMKMLGGANYFSAGPIILIRLNLCEFDEVYTNQIPGFFEKLSALIPSLYEHHCSYGVKGGFFQRVQEGTLLGHVIEHSAIELQTLAGMEVGYGKTRSTLEQGVYNIIFRFLDEEAGFYAGKAAVNMINALLQDQPFDIEEIVRNLVLIREARMPGPSTQAIIDEAEKRQIPSLRLDRYNLMQIGTGKYQKRIRATITSDTNMLAVETADNKYLTAMMMEDAGIPSLKTIRTDKIEVVLAFYQSIGSSITIKPIEGYLGNRIKYDLNNEQEIRDAFNWVMESENEIVVQPYFKGKNYRLLIVDFKFVAAVELTPPSITGDGVHTIKQLIDELNIAPERQFGDKGKLSKVEIDHITQRIITDRGDTLDTVLAEGVVLPLKNSGNMKLGGSSLDVTENVHPFNIFLAERAAKIIGLNVAGVDILSQDISQSLLPNNGVILEINAAPDFRMHLTPTFGKPRNVAMPFINMLFPDLSKTRIPIISLTGTVGKTTTAYLINYCLSKEGFKTGLTTTEGLYIANHCLKNGDMTFSDSAKLVLKDNTIDCAILETSREGVLRNGLGYKFADIGIVLNLHEEHVGHDDIKYIEDLAYAKSVVAEEVYDTGYTVLNADNELLCEMKERLYSKAILFAMSPLNPEIRLHLQQKGTAVYVENNSFVIHQFGNIKHVFDIAKMPLTYGGKATMMYENIMAAISCLFAFGLSPEKIMAHLYSFEPNMENLHGRMTFLEINNKRIFIDYAHNVISFQSLNGFLAQFEGRKIGVIDATGERLDEEIIELGEIAARFYDELYLYEGIDMRGRSSGQIVELLKRGVEATGYDLTKLHIEQSPEAAWTNAVKNANLTDLVVILTGRAEKTIEIIENIKEE